MAKIRFEHSVDCMIFEVSSGDSFERIDEALLDHCDESMQGKPGIAVAEVKYPVYYKELMNGSLTHIGYVNLEYDHDETIFIVRHFTLDKKELHGEWHPFSFYKGEYGVKPEKISHKGI